VRRIILSWENRGFALLLTLVLLALLVLLTLTMAALGRTGAQLAATIRYRAQARQNAQAAFGVALGELQRYAGPDDRVTGMAGVTGVPAGAGNPTRQWCGVWDSSGAFLTWLASRQNLSATPGVSAPPASVRLVGPMSVGNSSGAETENREFVLADKLPVTQQLPDLGAVQLGSYAYWVGDEGVKLSAVIPSATAAWPGVSPALDEIIPALSPSAPGLGSVLVFNQLAFVPATPLTPVGLAPGFHQLTVTHNLVAGPAPQLLSGFINVNSTSSLLWKGVAGTYNAASSTGPLSITTTVFGNRMRDNFPAASGKAANGPFLSTAAFLNGSNLLDTVLSGSGVTPAQFSASVGPLFSVRSDTFRIRAYGEALNPADSSRIEAAAYCEAVVQRTPASAPAGFGRRFTVVSFRWLSVDDL
jgi:Tfp pilus assembly protein PilX